ncbi:hypothetical protein CKO42_16625 [Lamprobacter modestohalophilus]|uniref:Uncharacterized protein n=1 Tax=Lamprobacter modestohalophilus TaxID=1064514 RepID=A0A9X0WAX7_9GAMM|nr:hypothetical protein [Lamprobacter modestohalophilus]
MKTPNPIEQAINPDLRGSWPALLRAAQRARALAIQTGTTIVVCRNGVIEHIRPEPEPTSPQVREQQGSHPEKS